jgi:hypothetical protein
MRKKKDAINQIEAENLQAGLLAAEGNIAGLLVLSYVREGEILRQLQELQANSWLR